MDRQTKTDRQTDRQTDRETGRQTEGQTDIDRHKQTDRHAQTQHTSEVNVSGVNDTQNDREDTDRAVTQSGSGGIGKL